MSREGSFYWNKEHERVESCGTLRPIFIANVPTGDDVRAFIERKRTERAGRPDLEALVDNLTPGD